MVRIIKKINNKKKDGVGWVKQKEIVGQVSHSMLR